MLRKFWNSLSQINFRKPSILFMVFTVCFAFWFVDFWKPYNTAKNQHQFTWDVMNYYSYLPAKFIYKGSFDFYDDPSLIFLTYTPDGVLVPKTTYGMSLLYSPFFALGYKVAINQRSPLDGFSEPFATSLHWGSIFYGLLGLLFLRKFLLVFFNEAVTTVTLFAVLFGTMLFFYTYVWAEMTHGYLFMLFSLFLLLTQRWHMRPTYGKTVLVGLTLGLICLIRPTEIYILLFFIFWNVRTWAEMKNKFFFFLGKWKHFLVMLLIGILYWVPQLLFWKNYTGSYFYFSYPGEKFFWGDPQIINILLSYRKGWITYTPLVVMAFVGFFFIRKDFPVSKWVFLFITAGIVYVFSCWWDWFFGGSFGARAFCQAIAFLSIPIASLIDFLLYPPRRFVLNGLFALATVVFLFSCVCLNLGHSYLFNKQRIHHDSMSEKIYWDIFRTYQFSDNYAYWSDLDIPDYTKMRAGERDQ